MRRLAMFCCSMCFHVLSAAPSYKSFEDIELDDDDDDDDEDPGKNAFKFPMTRPEMATPKTLHRSNDIFVAATMDSSIAITTLIIMGVFILLMIQVLSTLATMKMCKDDKCCSYSSLIILCVPFVIIISGVVFLFRKSPAMSLT